MIQLKLPPLPELPVRRGSQVPRIFSYAARDHVKCRYKDWGTGAFLMQWKTGMPVDLCINDFWINKSVSLEVQCLRDVFVFHFMQKGSAVLRFPGIKKMKLHAGEFNLFLMPADSNVSVAFGRGKHKSCHIFLKPEDVKIMGERYAPIRELVAAFEEGATQMRSGRIFAPISREMNELLHRLETDQAMPDLRFKRIYTAVFDIFTAYGDAVQGYLNRLRVAQSEAEKVWLIHQYIREHFHIPERMSIGALALWGGLSETSLKKSFTEKYKMPIHRFITHTRLSAARERLRNGLASATEIAYDVGYESPAAFHTAFVKAFGMTPKVYRMHQQTGGAPPDF